MIMKQRANKTTRQPERAKKSLAARFLRRRDGVAAVETAMVFPILLLFVFGAIEGARAGYTKAVLVFAIGEASRYAMARETASTGDIRTEISNHLPLLSPANIQSLDVVETNNPDQTKTVNLTLTYQFSSFLPVPKLGTFNLSASSSFIRE
jgi:Flp pilus assembly protein TadG